MFVALALLEDVDFLLTYGAKFLPAAMLLFLSPVVALLVCRGTERANNGESESTNHRTI